MEYPIVLPENGLDQAPMEGITDTVVPSLFIEANTEPISLSEIREKHLIPVFVKDNQPTISQVDFIQHAVDVVEELSSQRTANLSIRVSHPVKGRIFEARNKKASELEEWEKTIYYERMAFVVEIPAYTRQVNGQELTMTFGGIKAYNQDNLNNYGGGMQHFRFFIGYKVKVCTNLCVWTDGYSGDLKVRNLQDLTNGIYEVVQNYHSGQQVDILEQLPHYELSERQFAQLLGRMRLYYHLPQKQKKRIPQLLISDSQVTTMARAYYKKGEFRAEHSGSINLWNLYNLMTDAVKSSYIDTFLDRNVNAGTFISGLADALEGKGGYQWFLS